MDKVLNNPDNTAAIVDFIAKEFSWNKLFFKKLSVWQKSVLLFCDFCLLLPVYGAYQLFTTESLSFFIVFSILGIAAILLFFLSKERYAQQIFEKFYRSSVCSNITQYKLEKLSAFLGDYMTNENLDTWMNYFKGKTMKSTWWICFTVTIPVMSVFWTLHGDGVPLAVSIFVFGIMAFTLLFQILTTFKMPNVHNEAAKILSELLYSRIE